MTKVKEIQYTKEQTDIINAVTKYDSIKIFALAGTGKTTVLKGIADHYPDMKMLYIAFNHSIAEEAKKKFPANVDVYTTHGLAFKYTGRYYAFSKRLVGKFDCHAIASKMNITVGFVYNNIRRFERFLDSDAQCNPKSIAHFLYQSGIKDEENRKVTDFIYKLYFMLINKRCELGVTHSLYFKEFEQRFNYFKLRGKYDVILLDEAQDSNMVTLSVFNQFNAKRVMVGDSHQKIYGFRGAIDVMEKFESDVTLYLTHTFRFNNKKQVKIANDTLYYLKGEDADKLIKPAQNIHYDYSSYNDYCIITRTNAKLIHLLNKNDDLRPVRHPRNFFDPIIDIFKEKIPVLNDYENFQEYLDELEVVAEKTDDVELMSSVALVREYRDINFFMRLYDKAIRNRRRRSLNTYISTVHTVKGMEFDAVMLADDFRCIKRIIKSMIQHEVDNIQKYIRDKIFYLPKEKIRDFFKDIKSNTMKEEINLFYVAVTRAKKDIAMPPEYYSMFDKDVMIVIE